MKTILIPTDFSATASNAGRFAARFSSSIPGSHIILLHAYDTRAYGSDGTPPQLGEKGERNIAVAALNNHRLAMLQHCPGASIEVLALPGALQPAIEQTIASYKVTLVVMGINNSTGIDRFLTSSATISLLRQVNVPVFIIPEHAVYRALKNVIFATDLHDTLHSTPAAFLTELTKTFHSQLNVVHVGESNNTDTLNDMARILHDSSPVFHFLPDKGFSNTLNGFIEEELGDVLVLVSRKHDFLERAFKGTHTKAMARHSSVPVIAVPEAYCEAGVFS
jgi:nucleotide-binding universal stress UspA family protein